MSFRSLPTLFLATPVLLFGLVAGCDKQTSSNGQAAVAAPSAPAAPAKAGTFDRSHKGEAAPTLVFEGPDGKPTTLSAVMKASGGEPVLVNLWATWCGPCVKEMPTLDALAATMAVVPISQDKDRATVTAFFAKEKFARLQPYLDKDLGFSVAYNAELPMSILFDSTGHEVWRSTGGTDWTGAAAKAALAGAK